MPTTIPDLPADVQAAFDAAVDAHRRYEATYSMSSGNARIRERRAAVNDLHAANRALVAHGFDLPQQAARAAAEGGSR